MSDYIKSGVDRFGKPVKTKPKSEDISDVFTPEGVANLKAGHFALFEKATFLIHKVNKKSGKVLAWRTKLYTKDDIIQIDNGHKQMEYYDGESD